MRKCKIYCPVNEFDCPYYYINGECAIENPYEECDTFYSIWGDDASKSDYTCYEEKRTAYE